MEDPEWFDPYFAEFSPEETPGACDPILNSTLTGLEAEAMNKKYGETFLPQLSPRPWQLRTPASFFCGQLFL